MAFILSTEIDFTQIENLTNLKKLSLTMTRIDDNLSIIENLENLEELNLNDKNILISSTSIIPYNTNLNKEIYNTNFYK